MPPSRRALLRAGVASVVGPLAGCTGDEFPTTATPPADTTAAGTARRPTAGTTSDRQTTTETTSDRRTTDERTATPVSEGPAVEFVHDAPALDRDVTEAETWYAMRVFDGEPAVSELDPSVVPGDAPGQHPASVRRFVADTDFETTALVAVQVEVASARRGLDFAFVNREVSPPRVVAFVRERDGPPTDRRVSTLLVRVPAAGTPRFDATVVESDLAFESDLHAVVTFAPPNDARFESVRVRGRDLGDGTVGLPDPGGALVTGPDAASAFASERAVVSEFVRGTDFEESYLLAVRSSFDALDYIWPQAVVHDGSRVVADVRQYDPVMGINAVYSSLTLTRVPVASPPLRGTAVVRRYREHRPNSAAETETVPLSADPDEWRRPTGTTTARTDTRS